MKLKIDTIFFDIGGVLTTSCFNAINQHIFSFSKDPASPMPTDEEMFERMAEFFAKGKIDEISVAFGKGKISPGKFYKSSQQEFKKHLGYRGSAQDFKEMFVGLRGEKITENVRLLCALAQSGNYTVGIISDNNVVDTKKFENEYPEILKCLPRSYIFMSQEVGMLKDEGTGVFDHAMRKTKSKPANCVMIDDSPGKLACAKAAGMHTICYKHGTTNLARELKKLGVDVPPVTDL